jgi:hypothetical protein
MVSAFITMHHGWLRVPDDTRKSLESQGISLTDDERCATVRFEYGGESGYWTHEQLIGQLEKAIRIFELSYPDAQGVWIFDNSSNHAAYAEDALNPLHMNVGSGGAQSIMRATTWKDDSGCIHHQSMVLPDGSAKGMKLVLVERKLYRAGMTAEQMREVLGKQDDFKQQKCLVEEFIEAKGHRCLFLPKFHCELNPIELAWSAAKRYCRCHCGYSITSLRENVPAALESVNAVDIRAFWQHTDRYVKAYTENDCNGLEAKELVKKHQKQQPKVYKSHRRVSSVADLQALEAAAIRVHSQVPSS